MKTILQFISTASFTTAHLLFKKIQASDLDHLMLMDTNLQVMSTLGGIRASQQTKQDLDCNMKHWNENGFGVWLVYLKSTHEWVGRCALRRVTVDSQEEIEIAYALMPTCWNRGFATEIAKACAEIAFEVIRLDHVVCFTLTTNQASQRVMQKVGLQYERDIMHANLPHVLYRLKNPRKVIIVDYDNRWPDFFRQEAKRIQRELGSQLKEIHHIGSTAIPCMPAKPIIDMLLECNDLAEIGLITTKLNTLNYYNIRRQIIPHQSYFTRRQQHDIGFNLHIHESGSPQIKRHINFRDYLIAHPEDAKTYAALKKKLAIEFVDDMNNYVVGKDKLVQEIDSKAKLWPNKQNNYCPPNTGPLAKNWSHEKLVKAMVANLNVHMTHFAQYLNQVELIRIPGYTIVNSGLPDDTFNYVLDADFSAAEANKKIAEVTDYFQQKNVPFSWWLSPYDQPKNLEKYLESNGYQHSENNIAMYFDLDAWNGHVSFDPELTIIQAKEQKTLGDFALVLANDPAACKTYFSWIAAILTDDDPIEYYVGYVNGKPVVRGLSCYFAQVAGLHWLSTTADEQKKGYGTAMQQFRLKRAKQLGYHIAVLLASSTGYPLYQRLGYKECGIFSEFKLIPAKPTVL